MIAQAVAAGPDPSGHLRGRRPARLAAAAEPVDVLVSNATLQWVPGHLDLLPRLVDAVRPGGWLAFQVPANFGRPEPHRDDRPGDLDHGGRRPSRAGTGPGRRWPSRRRTSRRWPGWAARSTCGRRPTCTCSPGDDAVVRWTSGTGLRPYLQALPSAEDREAFLAEYRRAGRPRLPAAAVGHGAAVPPGLRGGAGRGGPA